jgi:hypothetical protein
MEDEYLIDCLLVYIEKKITKKFSVDSIIDDFVMCWRCILHFDGFLILM